MQALLLATAARLGGDLTTIAVARAEPVGGMTVVAALVADGRDYLPPTPEWMVRVECDDVAATVR